MYFLLVTLCLFYHSMSLCVYSFFAESLLQALCLLYCCIGLTDPHKVLTFHFKMYNSSMCMWAFWYRRNLSRDVEKDLKRVFIARKLD